MPSASPTPETDRAEGEPSITPLVVAVYEALRTGDRDRLEDQLAPTFTSLLTPGLPAPIGGRHEGPAAAIDDGWWAIGARFAVRAEPEQWLACVDGSLLVTGTYRGHVRATRRPVDAIFAHHWTGEAGRLTGLVQYTDSAAWAGDTTSVGAR